MDRSIITELYNLIGKEVYIIPPYGREILARIVSVSDEQVEVAYLGSVLNKKYKSTLKRFIPLDGTYDFRPKPHESRN